MTSLFSKIRLAYLEDMINDPSVQKAIRKSTPEDYLDHWTYVNNPSGKSDWPKSLQDRDDHSGRADFTVSNVVSIWSDDPIHVQNNGRFAFTENRVDFYYSEEFDCLVYVGGGHRRSVEEINKTLIVTLARLKDGDLHAGNWPMERIDIYYDKWINNETI